jgi:8-oxo-dGTP pyrophosphatase MutT (NUDIX family)
MVVETSVAWMFENRQWFFDGLGIALIGALVALYRWRIRRVRSERRRIDHSDPTGAAQSASPAADSESPASALTGFHLRRQAIHWGPLNDQVKQRFWVAGTSLVGVVERDLVATLYERGVRDIKVLLPSTDVDTLSYRQLHLFDAQPTGNLVYSQVDAARRSMDKLTQRISGLPEAGEHGFLRPYNGIMYYNIAVFDDDAFVAFYDTTGLGDNAPTVHFNARTSPDGYKLAIDEFQRMWRARPELGFLPNKRRGCSMIFTRHDNSILLYRRDDKASIRYPDCWDLLGGHVEPGETPEHAIARELEEEIEYRLDRPVLFRAIDMPDRIEFVFWKIAAIKIDKTTLHEGQYLRWFSASEISALPAREVAFGLQACSPGLPRDTPSARRPQ